MQLARKLRKTKWFEALRLWRELSRVKERSKVCSALIVACGGHWQTALQLLAHLDEASMCEASCSAAITACGKAFRWDEALKIFNSAPMQANNVMLNATMAAFQRGSQWPMALKLLKSHFDIADVTSFNSAIAACGKGHEWQLALELTADMQLLRRKPDQITYGSLIMACEKASEWQRALAISERLESFDAPAFANLISACERGRRWQEAIGFLEMMRRQAVEVSAALTGVVIGACIKRKKLFEGLKIYESMLQRQLRPHEITSSSLVSAFSLAWQWSRALQLAGQSRLTSAGLLAAVTAAQQMAQWQEALALLEGSVERPLLALTAACVPQSSWLLREIGEKLRSSKVLVEQNSAMTAAERCSRWPLALLWLAELPERSLQPDGFSVAAGIQARSHAGHWQHAVELLLAMESSRLSPDVVVYSSTITACERAEQWEMAFRVLDHMRRAEISPNVVTFSACVATCARQSDWTNALRFLEAAQRAGQSSVIAGNAAIAACSNAFQWQVSLLLLQQSPTPIGLSSAISACERSAEWQQALQLLSELQGTMFGHEATGMDLSSCISACLKAGESERAAALLKRKRMAPKPKRKQICLR